MTKQVKREAQKLGEIPVSVRMPPTLETEISTIARETYRSRNNAILQLLRKGIDAYREDGILVDTRPMHVGESVVK